MKKIIFLMMSILLFQGCSSQIYVSPEALESMVNAKQFTFMAEKANTSNADVINAANSIPTYSASRMMRLDYGYSLILKENSITAALPYFGRVYNANIYDTDKQGINFSSKDFSITQEKNKKGTYLFKINPRDVSHINVLHLEIYKNGKATLSVDAQDRQPISYDGYIMKNEETKK